MIHLKNIRPLSDFQRNAKSHIARLKKTGEIEVLTVNGEAELVVLSAEAYQELMAKFELAQTLNIAHGTTMEALRSGQISPNELIPELTPHPEHAGIPVDQAFAEIRQRIERRRKKKKAS